jgi:ectoine hydroxylase-related dioxygenase (phytanoyl-CoA dioxygenase family)
MLTLIEQFENHGFVVVEDVLDPQQDIQPVIDDYATALDNYSAQLYNAGKISSRYAELPFGQRFCRILAESQEPCSTQ